MRHQRLRQTLGLRTEERKALLASLVSALARKGRIQTTVAKAKAAQRFVEHLITISKRNTLHARRSLIAKLRSNEIASIFLDEIAPSVNGRKSGYTRIIRYKYRIGDGAETALLEFTDPIERREAGKPKKDKKKKAKSEMPVEAEEVKKPKKVVPGKKEKEAPAPHVQESEAPPTKGAEEQPKEKPKKGGFLSGLRKFLKGED
ncbi:MAG: 50S ribosomal protein L17 [Candidatus Omnitrophica bacterium]|nr:50S ribosomal protein L17 [Candidatus Omnitrophota bacterium]